MIEVKIEPWKFRDQNTNEYQFKVQVIDNEGKEHHAEFPIILPIHKSLLDELFDRAQKAIEIQMDRTLS